MFGVIDCSGADADTFQFWFVLPAQVKHLGGSFIYEQVANEDKC